jgi:uncharacterized LabA/DUF88 family protein
MATNVYVDGPNLYYAALRDRPVRWLDLATWCDQLLPDHDIKRVRYFTAWAHPAVDRQQVNRQQVYLRALQTSPKISVHFGRCLNEAVRLREPRTSNEHLVTKVRMKGVDVALASQLLTDAATGDCDTVVLVSNDSDFKPTIIAARRALRVRVGMVNPSPRGRVGSDKRKLVNFYLQPPPDSYAAALFPAEMSDARGPFHAPPRWFETDPRRR